MVYAHFSTIFQPFFNYFTPIQHQSSKVSYTSLTQVLYKSYESLAKVLHKAYANLTPIQHKSYESYCSPVYVTYFLN